MDMLSYIDDFFDQVYVEVAVLILMDVLSYPINETIEALETVAVLILMDVLSYHFYLRKNVGATHVAVVSL